MDLREFQEMPDEGLYEKIEHRVHQRRWVRVGTVAMVVAVAAGTVVLSLPWGGGAEAPVQEMAVAEVPVVVAEESTMTESQAQTSQVAVVQPKETTVSLNNDGSSERMKPLSFVTDSSIILVTSAEAAMAEQPALPPAAVRHEEAPLADLISVANETEDNVVVPASTASKSGENAPETPHYDNLLWAPNIISPLAEEESDREFKVQATSPVSDFRLAVYNRGGRQIFITNDINHAWDAKRDGILVPQGTYMWIARFRDSSGTVRQEKGTVTVVR